MVRIAGKRVLIAGVVSARSDGLEELSTLESRLQSAGGRLVGTILQRHGVSRSRRPGGAKRGSGPLSPDTSVGRGKAVEIAQVCVEKQVELVVFLNPLSETQRDRLESLFGVPVVLPDEIEERLNQSSGGFA